MDVPLPPPREAAASLRQRGVDTLRKWEADFGRHYPALRLAVRATAGAAAAPLPAARDQATAAEEDRQRRQERTQQLLRERYESVRFELPTELDNAEILITELRECLAAAQPAPAPAPAGADGGGGEENLWEDVPIGEDAAAADAAAAAAATGAAAAASLAAPPRSGSSAAAAEPPPRTGSADSGGALPPSVLRESMTRILKALKRRYVPSLVDGISILSRVDVQVPSSSPLL